MRLKLDTVSGTEFQKGAFDGRYLRMGLIICQLSDLSLVAKPDSVINSLQVNGMPQIGDPLPLNGYDDWIVKKHFVRPIYALHYSVGILYEWLGTLRVKDSSTLSSLPVKFHPKSKFPFIITWKRPSSAQQIWKIVRLPLYEPMRHLTLSKTTQYQARVDVMNAFGTTNKLLWQGLPPGYWLFSGLEGETFDNGLTYNYSVTLSTRQWRDWSEYGSLEDDQGQSVVPSKAEITAIQAVMNKPYDQLYADTQHYTVPDSTSSPPGLPIAPANPGTPTPGISIDNSANGFLRAAIQGVTDFGALFGVN